MSTEINAKTRTDMPRLGSHVQGVPAGQGGLRNARPGAEELPRHLRVAPHGRGQQGGPEVVRHRGAEGPRPEELPDDAFSRSSMGRKEAALLAVF